MPAWPFPPAATAATAAAAAAPAAPPAGGQQLTHVERALIAHRAWSKSGRRGEPSREAKIAGDILGGYTDEVGQLVDLVLGGVELRTAARRLAIDPTIARMMVDDVHREVGRWLFVRIGVLDKPARSRIRAAKAAMRPG